MLRLIVLIARKASCRDRPISMILLWELTRALGYASFEVSQYRHVGCWLRDLSRLVAGVEPHSFYFWRVMELQTEAPRH